MLVRRLLVIAGRSHACLILQPGMGCLAMTFGDIVDPRVPPKSPARLGRTAGGGGEWGGMSHVHRRPTGPWTKNEPRMERGGSGGRGVIRLVVSWLPAEVACGMIHEQAQYGLAGGQVGL